MEKEEKLNIALQKLKQLLSLAPETDKEKVRIELSKMIPENKDASVNPKIGWGHFDDSIQTDFSFMVTPYIVIDKHKSLYELFSNLIEKSNIEKIDLFNMAFDVLLNKNPKQIRIGGFTSLLIASKTKAITTNFKIIY